MFTEAKGSTQVTETKQSTKNNGIKKKGSSVSKQGLI